MNLTPMTLDDFLRLAWVPVVEPESDGDGWRLTIPPLPDFEYYADTEEAVKEDRRGALRAHLQVYLLTGKAIPLPQFLEPKTEQDGSV